MNQCLVCNNDCKSKYCSLSCSNKGRERKKFNAYTQDPKLCPVCKTPIPWEKRWDNTFCSRSCAAIKNNSKFVKRTKKVKSAKKDWDLLFAQGLLSERSVLRKHLIKSQGNLCQLCQCPGEWHNQPLVLIVDHINGDASDNKPGNLRLLCPNCNSQTSTFSGRNKGFGRKSRGLSR